MVVSLVRMYVIFTTCVSVTGVETSDHASRMPPQRFCGTWQASMDLARIREISRWRCARTKRKISNFVDHRSRRA
jgi:hypothetical protein